MARGCTKSTGIDDCYNITLSSDPNVNLDTHFPNSPRQRMEFHTFNHSPGTTFSFEWKQYFPDTIGTSSDETSFFHVMQIFDVDIDFPIFTLDVFNNTVRFYDFAGDKCGDSCPSTPLEDYNGRTSVHNVGVMFGPSGWVDYTILDFYTAEEILYYHGAGIMGGNES
jgi:hypothetical protein